MQYTIHCTAIEYSSSTAAAAECQRW